MSSTSLSMTSVTRSDVPPEIVNESIHNFVERFKSQLPEDAKVIADLLPIEIPKEEGISTDYSEEQIFKSEIEQLEYYTDNVLEAETRIELAYLKLISFPNTARLLEPLGILSDILFSNEVNPITSKEQFDKINNDLTIINDAINDVLNKNAQGVDVKDIDLQAEPIKSSIEAANGLFDVYKTNPNIKFVLRRDARALIASLPTSPITANPFKGSSILSSSITPITAPAAPAPAPATGTVSSATAPAAPAPAAIGTASSATAAPAPAATGTASSATTSSATAAPAPVKGGKSRRRRTSRNYKRTQKRSRS